MPVGWIPLRDFWHGSGSRPHCQAFPPKQCITCVGRDRTPAVPAVPQGANRPGEEARRGGPARPAAVRGTRKAGGSGRRPDAPPWIFRPTGTLDTGASAIAARASPSPCDRQGMRRRSRIDRNRAPQSHVGTAPDPHRNECRNSTHVMGINLECVSPAPNAASYPSMQACRGIFPDVDDGHVSGKRGDGDGRGHCPEMDRQPMFRKGHEGIVRLEPTTCP